MTTPRTLTDEQLLRRFEPILRFTEGELFFPMPTDGYVAGCDLLVGEADRGLEVVVPHGELSLERLGEVVEPAPGKVRFMRFVQEPLDPIALARWNNRPDRPRFRAPGRLARVGLLARMLDAGSVASLLVRGKVPGGTAAAAAVKYDEIRDRDPRISYHARVVREAGLVVLQYLFFYAMNDWRSSFDGANDHEADWEQAFVVLEELTDGEVRPVWFAAAAHDEEGDDLRRRWDDPRLELIGEHPVVYPGAGSHATYLERGEYLMRLPLPGDELLRGVLEALRRFWRDTLGQPDPGDIADSVQRALSVPFVDYARGDGLAVGPGQEVEWSPILIDDAVPWVDAYRGLWGLDTRDRLAGERAPAGPKYTRTGAVRQSWNDPLGFVGLAKVPTPSRVTAAFETRMDELGAELAAVEAEADGLARSLPGLDIEVRSLEAADGIEAYRERRGAELADGERRLAELRTTAAELRTAIVSTRTAVARWVAGDHGDPRAHLSHAATPEPPEETRTRVFAETWAALSVGLLVIALAVILWFRVLPVAPALLVLGIGYLAIESFAQRRVETLLLRVVILLALFATVLLAATYARELLLLALAGLGAFILIDNLREIRRR